MQIPSFSFASTSPIQQTQRSGSSAPDNQREGSKSASQSTDPSAVLKLSGNAPKDPSTGYTSTGAPTSRTASGMLLVEVDYFAFSEGSPFGKPEGPTRLEYNVYRPDGFEIDASQKPFVVKSTGESMTPAVTEKYRQIVMDVTKGRIDLYKAGKAEGLSDEQIRAKLQEYDRNQPDSYKDLVGKSDMVDPAYRYMNATWDETMGGPVQYI